MTNGQLFIKENPTVEIKINGSCVWIYFDGVNHYTMPVEWWDKEIGLFKDIKAEINQICDDIVCKHIHKEDVFKIIERNTGKEKI